MPALLVIIVLGVLAFIGYQYVYKQEQPPQTVEQATQQAKEAAGEAVSKAREALTAAGQALGPAAEQAFEPGAGLAHAHHVLRSHLQPGD